MFPSAPRTHLRQHWVGILNVTNQMSQAFDEETRIAGRQTPVFRVEDVLVVQEGEGWMSMASVCFLYDAGVMLNGE